MQERKESCASLISCLNTSFVKFKCAVAVNDDNQTVESTLKAPAMITMSYDELTIYLIALDPDESGPSIIVYGAHAAISTGNCSFCNNRGHSIRQCRKLQALIKSCVAGKPRVQGRNLDGRIPYDRRIDKSVPRHDMRDYRYLSKNNDKYNRPDSDSGYRTRDERYNRNNCYQYRYDNHDDHDRQDYRVDRYNRRDEIPNVP
ncbi:hypothetical protein SARC_04046 [Sphaeroforma arctica JP610]|uniref:CCHC-type domain-containing protein n=1 Tax=Sphaeroforma arctica JP610 TaxID=667725 RepID=A0A0L0G4H7_9EUKA|nr:hypothetical protein SARC_04046 [Sphaeroforma arctica JP610]KNC83716.1 hypothetical protein SARC_04046 [Sphaeroforma arctica JP610]|eukprot:XP_014157618.1 hypothetical protein SARC_04046 [Sphaeroforma arctica JP610]